MNERDDVMLIQVYMLEIGDILVAFNENVGKQIDVGEILNVRALSLASTVYYVDILPYHEYNRPMLMFNRYDNIYIKKRKDKIVWIEANK